MIIKRVLVGLLAALLLLAAVLVVNTLRQGSRQVPVSPLPPLAVDEARLAETMALAVRPRTVSGLLDPAGVAAEFDKLHAQLLQRYPLLHATLTLEHVGGHSLLYTWAGSDAAAQPFALLAHQDVVPIAPGTESLWKKPPFAGVIEDGMVWGRGTLDNKSNLVTQMEAIEVLLRSGFKPRRTVYLIAGHDEEVGGQRGALAIVNLFKQRGVKLEYVIDEGLAVTEGILPGLAKPLALVGLAEKGSVSIKLTARTAPGHSSMPPAQPGQSAIAMLSEALSRLDRQPMPGGVQGAAAALFAAVAPELPFAQRLALSNLWLMRPVVEAMLGKSAVTNAMMRTTTAMTMLNAGIKDNVLPGQAEAVVNFRILPGDTAQSVAEHVKRAIADERIVIQPQGVSFEASSVSSPEARAFKLIERTTREVFPEALVAPGLMLAGSDARHFQAVADNAYRFMPIRFKPEDLPRLHGTDERISVPQLADMVRFYHRLLQQSAQ
jgi:carboxypeptidase PM20D1